MTAPKEELLALAETIANARNYFDLRMDTTAEFLAALGLQQVFYHRAGWKFIYPESGRPGSALRPFASLDDLRSVYRYAGISMPDMIPSCPLKASAACLRSHAQEGRGE